MKCLLAALPFALLLSPAHADEALPGVKGGHTIVQPEPNDPEPLQTNEDGSIQIGNTRVKISGSVTVDIGAGNLPPPRK